MGVNSSKGLCHQNVLTLGHLFVLGKRAVALRLHLIAYSLVMDSP